MREGRISRGANDARLGARMARPTFAAHPSPRNLDIARAAQRQGLAEALSRFACDLTSLWTVQNHDKKIGLILDFQTRFFALAPLNLETLKKAKLNK